MEPWIPYLIQFASWIMAMVVLIWLSNHLLDKLLAYKRQIKSADIQNDRQRSTQQLKLQAYERLLLLLDRITLPSLLTRINTQEADAEELSLAMHLTIQREFEHNITQRLYVKDNLWQIIQLVREELSTAVQVLSEQETGKVSKERFIQLILHFHQTRGKDLVEKAMAAIKEESTLAMN